jgi:hypothetical protein
MGTAVGAVGTAVGTAVGPPNLPIPHAGRFFTIAANSGPT